MWTEVLFDEFTARPHVFHGQIGVPIGIIFEMFLNRIITKMNVLLARRQTEMFRTETEVTIFEHPDRQRIPIGHQKPLANVKFRIVNEQRPFDVLLYDEFSIVDQIGRAEFQNVVQSIVDDDA